MRFCNICRNYLFLKEEPTESKLFYHCVHCGFKEEMGKPSSLKEALILETRFGTSGKQTESQINDYTRMDPTLPHLRDSIPCPNAECPSQTDVAQKDILFIKTDPRDLKYQYCCMACNTTWGN